MPEVLLLKMNCKMCCLTVFPLDGDVHAVPDLDVVLVCRDGGGRPVSPILDMRLPLPPVVRGRGGRSPSDGPVFRRAQQTVCNIIIVVITF